MDLRAADQLRLSALRYATSTEAGQYLSVMRVFTGGTSGLMSDLSAGEVSDRLAAEHGMLLEESTVEDRLSYLAEHGNLARSPRESRARTIEEYLRTRSRYQLTALGELTHRLVEELLGATDTVREVSTEMLGAIHQGLAELDRLDAGAVAVMDPEELSRRISTVFVQHRNLVESTREFYSYLGQVLGRYDLGREDFRAFKTVLLDYLQRFVDEIARHMPQIGDILERLVPRVPALVARANDRPGLVDVTGVAARRNPGLAETDWQGLRSWFLGGGGRESDAAQVRSLATDAMRALVVNLRRIVGEPGREVSRRADVMDLARRFAATDDQTAHALWANVFGLYPARHLGFPAAEFADVPATASWLRSAVADVPVSLLERGERRLSGRVSAAEDFTAVKAHRLAIRRAQESSRRLALTELAAHAGFANGRTLTSQARGALLDLHSRAMADHAAGASSARDRRHEAAEYFDPSAEVGIRIRADDAADTRIHSPDGDLTFRGMTIEILVAEQRYEPSTTTDDADLRERSA
jgi:uncharacterized protein (TIGR02677 family)